MDYHTQVPDTFTLAGDYEQRLVQVLEIARHLARVAQGPAGTRSRSWKARCPIIWPPLKPPPMTTRPMPKIPARLNGNAGPITR
jgi:hypothetical protein